MNRTLSLLALFPFAALVETGCGSDHTEGVGLPIGDPDVANGSDASDGGPGNVCTGAAGCGPLSINRLCESPRTTLIKDGLPADDASNAMIQAALVANCVPAPKATSLEKGASGAIDPTTGRPTTGDDDLLTAAGGAYVQKAVSYLDFVGATPVYLVANDATSSWQYVSRSPGRGLVAELPYAKANPSHDIVLIEFVRDWSGARILVAFGQQPESTAAAARYVAQQMVPNRSRYDKSWYVYEWTGPGDAGDTPVYALKASGP